MTAASLAAYAGQVLLSGLRWAFAAAHPDLYLRWREPIAALLTAATLVSPIPTQVLYNMARGVGAAAATAACGAAGAPASWLAHPALLTAGLVRAAWCGQGWAWLAACGCRATAMCVQLIRRELLGRLDPPQAR